MSVENTRGQTNNRTERKQKKIWSKIGAQKEYNRKAEWNMKKELQELEADSKVDMYLDLLRAAL